MSREHLVIEASGDQGVLMLRDRSSNGVTVNGVRLPAGGAQAITSSDVVELAGLRLRIAAATEPAAALVAHVYQNGGFVHSIDLSEAALRARTNEAGDHELSLIGESQPTLQRLLGREGAFCGVCGREGGGGVLHTPEAPAVEVSVNRQAVGGGVRPLEAYDLVTFGATRIEVLPRGARAIRCANPACERLNVYDPSINCRWCGFKLVEGTTLFARR